MKAWILEKQDRIENRPIRLIELPTPHINQQQILSADKRFIVVMCGRRFGKSELSQILIIKEALNGGQVAYITPTYKLAQVFFERLTKVLPFKNNIQKLKDDEPFGGRTAPEDDFDDIDDEDSDGEDW